MNRIVHPDWVKLSVELNLRAKPKYEISLHYNSNFDRTMNVLSNRADNIYFPDSPSPTVPIIHRSWQVFQTTSSVCTELMKVGSYCSAHIGATMCRGSIKERRFWVRSCFSCMSCSYWIFFFWKMVLFTNPSARAGYDTRSIFKRSLTGLNSEFSFS